jgi:hypothetical protein
MSDPHPSASPSALRASFSSPAAALALAILAFAVLGFFPSYFGLLPTFPGVSSAIHFHAAAVVLWLLLVLAQAVLVRRGRAELHKRLGRLGFVMLPLVMLSFLLAMNDGQLRHKNPELLLATAFDGLLFLTFAGLGLLYRRRTPYHRGFMFLALLPFLNPSLGRLLLPQLSLPVEFLAMVALLLRARKRKEPLFPYAFGLGFSVVALGLLVAIMVGLPEVPERLWQALYGASSGS